MGDLLHAEGLAKERALWVVQGQLLVERGADLEGGRGGGTDAGQQGLGGQAPGQPSVGVSTVILQL